MSALRAAAPRATGRAGTRRPPGSLLLCFSAFALPCLAAPFSLRCVTFLLRSVGSPHRHVAASPRRRTAPRVRACREFIVVRTAISSDDFGRGA
ncbi:hypothetical protein DO73_5374 [Burkholderia pseudomallei]|nr:hypothetical protein DO73_5374 [Burkholderia pseudomallei]